MLHTLLNYVFAFGLAGILAGVCDVPIEDALLVGSVVGIFYTLSDISSHLRKSR